MRYEDLHRDSHAELARVLEFLGVRGVSDESLRHAVAFAGFDHLHSLERSGALDSRRLRPADHDDPESFKTRVGKVGGYREHLSTEDLRFVSAQLRELPELFGYPSE